jgi:hypothetical protein
VKWFLNLLKQPIKLCVMVPNLRELGHCVTTQLPGLTPIIPATWVADVGRIWFKDSLGKQFSRPPSPK